MIDVSTMQYETGVQLDMPNMKHGCMSIARPPDVYIRIMLACMLATALYIYANIKSEALHA